jgi:hypothetical protein
VEVVVKAEDGAGNLLNGFVGKVSLKLLNSKMGALMGPGGETSANLNLPIENGQAKFKIRSSLKAGELVVIGNTEGYEVSDTDIALQ